MEWRTMDPTIVYLSAELSGTKKVLLYYLLPPKLSDNGHYRMFGYSSREAAKKLGISFPTLNRYIAEKKIPLPPVVKVGGVAVRLWSDKDIQRVRAILPRIKNGRKTRFEKAREAQAKRKSKR